MVQFIAGIVVGCVTTLLGLTLMVICFTEGSEYE